MFDYTPYIPILIAIIAIALTYSSYRSINGTKFTRGSTSLRIILYLALLVYSVANTSYPYYIILAIGLALVIGLICGVKFGVGVRFYHKKGKTYYKRSAIVVVAWLIAILIRITFDLTGQGTFLSNFIIDIALALTVGLMAGEALHIARGYRAHIAKRRV